MAPPKEKWVRRFIIPETARHKKGFTIYKVTSVVFSKTSREEVSKVSVWKRYNDFKKLYRELGYLYGKGQIKEPFPTFPKSRFFGRFEAEVIEERKQSALKLMEFIGRYSYLYSSDIFIKFFETSLTDNCAIDCSQSTSSDTSEDDHHANYLMSSMLHISGNDSLTCFDKDHKKNKTEISGAVQTIANGDHRVSSKDKAFLVTHADESEIKNQTGQYNNSTVCCGNSVLPAQQTGSLELIHEEVKCLSEQKDCTQYILIAAAHISAAVRHEAMVEYEEAFTQYKMGISNLLTGVQSDCDMERAAMIKKKISKYLEKAEQLYNKHLNCNVSLLSRPTTELQNYKVLKIMKSMMLVQDIKENCTKVVKTIEKLPGDNDISNYILRGQIPYMLRLHAFIETETTVFLILEHIRRGKLWDYVSSCYPLCKTKNCTIEEISNQSIDKKFNKREIQCQSSLLNTIPIKIETSSLDTLLENMEDLQVDLLKNFQIEKHASYGDDLPTTRLLEKSQQLLQSVNATLKKSNSIASRLNENSQLMYLQDSIISSCEQKSCDRSERTNIPSEDQDGSSEAFSINEINNATERIQETDHLCSENKENPKILIHSSSNKSEIEERYWNVPEEVARQWAAEILLAIEALHQQEVIAMDLNPNNILIDDSGHVQLTYIIPHRNRELLKLKHPYSSPELCMFLPTTLKTPASDIWSFGVILFELLTGTKFKSRHPGSFHSHSTLNIPDKLSSNAKSLLLNILKYEPSDRFTIPEVKQHPFFAGIDWSSLMNS